MIDFTQGLSALLVVSTALVGFAGIFLVQLKFSKEIPPYIKKHKQPLTMLLSASILVGFMIMIVIILAFILKLDLLTELPFHLFIAQLIFLIFTSIKAGLLF